LFVPPTEHYYGPCGTENPLSGNPSGHGLLEARLMRQYSCSIPNQGFSSGQASKIFLAK